MVTFNQLVQAFLVISLEQVAHSLNEIDCKGFSWNTRQTDISDSNLAQLLDRFVFKDKANVMGKLVIDLGNTHLQTGKGGYQIYYFLFFFVAFLSTRREVFKQY